LIIRIDIPHSFHQEVGYKYLAGYIDPDKNTPHFLSKCGVKVQNYRFIVLIRAKLKAIRRLKVK